MGDCFKLLSANAAADVIARARSLGNAQKAPGIAAALGAMRDRLIDRPSCELEYPRHGHVGGTDAISVADEARAMGRSEPGGGRGDPGVGHLSNPEACRLDGHPAFAALHSLWPSSTQRRGRRAPNYRSIELANSCKRRCRFKCGLPSRRSCSSRLRTRSRHRLARKTATRPAPEHALSAEAWAARLLRDAGYDISEPGKTSYVLWVDRRQVPLAYERLRGWAKGRTLWPSRPGNCTEPRNAATRRQLLNTFAFDVDGVLGRRKSARSADHLPAECADDLRREHLAGTRER